MTNPNDVPRLKHIDSILQKVNVLDTTPQTVNGGMWRDSDVIKIFADGNIYHANLSVTANILAGGIFDIDGVYFKLTSFVDGLTIDRTREFKTGYPITFAGKLVGYLKIDGGNYDFSFSDKSALDLTLDDTATTKTISVKQVNQDGTNYSGTNTVTCTLDLSDISDLIIVENGAAAPEAGNTGTWEKDTDENYYVYTIGEDTFYARKGSDASSYTYTKQSITTNYPVYYVQLADWNLKTDYDTDAPTGGWGNAVYIGKYVTVDATNPNSPIAIFSKAAVTTEEILLKNEGNLIVSYDDGFKGILSDEAKAVNHTPAHLEAKTDDSGVYQFVTEKITPGFVETANGAVWYWDGTAKTLGGTTFTANQYGGIAEFEISGLIDGVKTYYNKKLNRYEVYKADDVNDDGTVKANATLLLTIDANRTPYTTGADNVIIDGTEVTIHSLEAFKNFTELGQTAEGGSITVKDIKAYSDNAAYILKFDSSLEKYTTADTSTSVAEGFTENAGTYTYKPEVIGWHFEKTDAVLSPTSGEFSSSLTYKPTAQVANNPPQFTITGLKSGLTDLKIVESTDKNYPYQIKTGDIVIGRIGKKGSNLSDGVQIYLKEAAMPDSPTSATVVSIEGEKCSLGLWMSSTSLTTHADQNTLTRSGANYTFTASGDSAGYKLYNGKIVYVEQDGGQQFRFTGLYNPSGATISLKDNGDIVRTIDNVETVIATVGAVVFHCVMDGTVAVTLKATAFNTGDSANDQTITFSDLNANNGIKYIATFDNNSNVAYSATAIPESFTYDNGTYTYQAAGTNPYFVDTISTNGIVRLVAQVDGQKFTITGLKDGLTLETFKNAATLSKVGSTTTVTLTDPAILSGTMTDVILTDPTDNIGNEQTYKLAFGDAFYS